MKVDYCKNCQHYKRKVWSSYYKPAGYHAIGVSHAYAYCERHKTRCLEVKNCLVGEKQELKKT